MKAPEAASPDFRRLIAADRDSLDQLISKYGAELSGKTRAPVSVDWTERLFQVSHVLCYGIFLDRVLVGFAIVFELPEAVFQTTCGQLDDLFVMPEARGKRLAGRLIEFICQEGRSRGWSHLRWLVPHEDASAIKLYEKIASEAPWRSFVIRLDSERSF